MTSEGCDVADEVKDMAGSLVLVQDIDPSLRDAVTEDFDKAAASDFTGNDCPEDMIGSDDEDVGERDSAGDHAPPATEAPSSGAAPLDSWRDAHRPEWCGILGESLTSREALESWRVTHHCETNASRQTEVILPVLCAQAWFVWHATCCLNSCLFFVACGSTTDMSRVAELRRLIFTLQLTALADQEASVVLMPFMPPRDVSSTPPSRPTLPSAAVYDSQQSPQSPPPRPDLLHGAPRRWHTETTLGPGH